MKRIILIAFLSFIALPGFSQTGSNTVFGFYAGGGCATYSNYNVAPELGLEFLKALGKKDNSGRSYVGADVHYQTFSLRYDNEQNSGKHGDGNAGVILKHLSTFAFIAPKFEYSLDKKQIFRAYVSFGVGFKMSGYDTLVKWDHSYTSGSVGNYDSTIDMTKNINSMLLRVGFGFRQFLPIGNGKWHVVFTEDFGFLPSSLTKTADVTTPARTQYSPTKLNPGYISLQIGIFHTKYP